MEEGKKIINWLDSHPLFSINGMCRLIKADTSNFMKYKNKGVIQEKHFLKIKKIIKNYGYDETMS